MDIIVPHLLHLVYAPEEAGPKARAVIAQAKEQWDGGGGADDEDDDDGDYDEINPSPGEVAAAQKDEPKLMQAAEAWDHFDALMYAGRPWDEDDTDAYRKTRAVEYFNAGCHIRKVAI